MRRDQLWLVPLGIVVFVSCMRAAEQEPYDYEDDDDKGMFPAGGDLVDDDDYEPPIGSSHMDGTWRGECLLELYGYYTYTFGLRLELETAADGSLSGHGSLSVYGYGYDGEIEGTYNGYEAELGWNSGGYYGYGIDVNLAGEVDDEVFSGNCRVVGYIGDFEVERD